MRSSSFTCVKSSDLDVITKAAKAYGRLAKTRTVTRSAVKAGQHLNTAMQQTVKGEPSLSAYHHVADAFHVYESDGNVHVGLPESHELYGTALEMDRIYPVANVVMDLARQQGDTEAVFHDELRSRSRAWWQRALGMRGVLS